MRNLAFWVLLVLAALVGSIILVLQRNHQTWHPLEGEGPVPLRIGYAIEPPYAFVDAQGRVRGEAPEVLRAVLHRLGEPEPVWLHFEFPTLLDALRAGRIDVIASGLFITPERQGLVEFTRPTERVGEALLVAAGNPHELHQPADLLGQPALRLAVIAGSVEAEVARKAGLSEAQLLRVPDALSGFESVRNGTAAALALSVPSLRWQLTQGSSEGIELHSGADPAADPASANGLSAFALRRGDPRVGRLDQALAGWLGSAEHLAIARHYGFSVEPPGSAATPSALRHE